MKEEEPAGFLSRWSRRKQAAVRGEPLPPLPEEPAPAEQAPEQNALEEAPLTAEAAPAECAAPDAEPEFDVASLPPIETLDASSDFTVFLRRGVPELLRNAALRRAWVADPLIRDHMGSLDYAWDFNTPGGLPNGFASTLGETGEALRKLIAQAIGEIQPEEEKPPGEVTDEIPVEAEMADAANAAREPAALPEPATALRLTEEEPPEPAPARAEEPYAPTRRYGGARPA